MGDLYRIDWKKLTEGLDDKELLFIEGCVEEATMKPLLQWRNDNCYSDDDCVLKTERGTKISVDMTEFWTLFDAAVGEETP